jgi:hypothetical protein
LRFWLHRQWTVPGLFSGVFPALFQDKAGHLCLEHFQKFPGRGGGKPAREKNLSTLNAAGPPVNHPMKTGVSPVGKNPPGRVSVRQPVFFGGGTRKAACLAGQLRYGH